MSCDFCEKDTHECCVCEKEVCDDCIYHFKNADGYADTSKHYCPDCYDKEKQRREEAEKAALCQICSSSALYNDTDAKLHCSLCGGVTCSEHLAMFAGGRICPKCTAERREVLGVAAA